jgi:hypothetical protein
MLTLSESLALMELSESGDHDLCIATISRNPVAGQEDIITNLSLMKYADCKVAELGNVYVAPAHFRPGSIAADGKGRSTENVERIPFLAWDIDIKDYISRPPSELQQWSGDQLDAYTTSLITDAREVFGRVDIPIHRIVVTGYGIHVWTRLAESDQQRLDEIRHVYKGLTDRINRTYGGPLTDKGAKDVGTRFLRVHGTWNSKGETPRPVRIFPEFESDGIAHLDDFDIAPPAPRAVVPRADERRLPSTTEDKIVEVLSSIYHEGERNPIQLAAPAMLAKAGVPRDQAHDIFAIVGADDGDDKRHKAIDRTYDKYDAGLDVSGYTAMADLLGEKHPALLALGRLLPFSRSPHSGASTDSADGTDTADGVTQSSSTRGRDSQATQLVDLILGSGAELFHDADDTPYITLSIGDHQETHAVDRMGRLANRLYFQTYGSALNSQTVQDAISVLGGKAIYDGATYTVWTRLGEHEGALYLDIGDEFRQAVEITAAGWRIVSSQGLPLRFRRPKGMHALPIPERDGSLHDLDPFINASDDRDRTLIKGWLIGLFCRSGGRAILELLGEQGTSKSTLARMLRSLVDPRTAPLRAAPRDEGDLMIAAKNGLIVAYDNLSYLNEAMSDAFCRLSTGGGIGKRQLYTDDEEVTLEAQRPILLTGITSVATRSDMLDRTISMTLQPIPPHERRTEESVWAEFGAAQPAIFGGLLNAVSTALANQGKVCLDHTPRLADFVIWVEAAGPSLDWERGAFAAACDTNRSELDEIALESQPISQAVLSLMEKQKTYTGTASALLSKLGREIEEDTRRERSWPKSASQCSRQLKRLAPNLRRTGVEVTWERGGSKGTRTITLRRVPVA